MTPHNLVGIRSIAVKSRLKPSLRFSWDFVRGGGGVQDPTSEYFVQIRIISTVGSIRDQFMALTYLKVFGQGHH